MSKPARMASYKKQVQHIVNHGRGTLIKAYLRGVRHGIKPVVIAYVKERDDGMLLEANCCDVSEVLPEDAGNVARVSPENFPVLILARKFNATIGIRRPD